MVRDLGTIWHHLYLQLTLNDRFVDLLEEGFDVTLRIVTIKEDDPLTTHEIAPIR